MKLRNKKTGEIVEFGSMRQYWREEKDGGMAYLFQKQGDNVGIVYNSIAELNEEWEDYNLTEPLIKDEKIRKAVRAWAEANNIRAVYYSPDKQGFYVKNFDDEIVAAIYFGDTPMEEYEYDWNYTIAELCGEEEE